MAFKGPGCRFACCNAAAIDEYSSQKKTGKKCLWTAQRTQGSLRGKQRLAAWPDSHGSAHRAERALAWPALRSRIAALRSGHAARRGLNNCVKEFQKSSGAATQSLKAAAVPLPLKACLLLKAAALPLLLKACLLLNAAAPRTGPSSWHASLLGLLLAHRAQGRASARLARAEKRACASAG